MLIRLLVFLSIGSLGSIAESTNNSISQGSRDSRVFSLFSIVSFKNNGCRSLSALTTGQSPVRNGTCYTSSECDSKGGKASGNCAAGFGVCCLFLLTSGTISQNCTYIRNTGFPTALTTASPVNYIINKVSNDICYIRLDMETFNILGPPNETGGGVCPDSLTVTAPGSGQKIPVICGFNNGQHIYVNTGNVPSDVVNLAFSFTGASTATTSRMWEIKVSQIECNNLNRPPDGCLQYFTTATGRITTFNFLGTSLFHIGSQDVTACIRQQSGYCCVTYQVCNDFNADGFSLDSRVSLSAAAPDFKAFFNTQCTLDYVAIPGATGSCTTKDALYNKFCSTTLNPSGIAGSNVPVCDCTPPFTVTFHTDAMDEGALVPAPGDPPIVDAVGRGVCFDYKLQPC